MKEVVNKFKGKGSKWITQGLFLEVSQTPASIMYTLQTWDKQYKGKHLPSLHKLYVDMEDLAEFEFANKYFANYEHWLRIKCKTFFKPYYEAMVKELNAKIRGRSLNTMLKQLAAGEATQSTLKYLADNDYIPKATRGRPSKQSVQEEIQSQAKLHTIYNSDLERIK